MSRTYKTEGIILKRINYGETDRILTILSKHYGKIKAIAKGVRQVTSRKGGNLELFNQTELFLAKGKNLDIITQAEALKTHQKLREDLILVGWAFHLAEIVDQLTAERQKERGVYRLLVDIFRKLDHLAHHDQALSLVREFEINLLEELGFGGPKKEKGETMEKFMEKIIERRLKSKKIWEKIK